MYRGDGTEQRGGSADDPFDKKGDRVVDADTHMTEQHDLWTSRDATVTPVSACPRWRSLDGVA